ncbi:MAG TPA: efflux RND transporter periplasmic adaptor subunit [Longimicrobiales bacterium]|nr:efflux RND transporter periplasmic adaptor subunit [Longimicrobiales bacterium]
MSPGRKRIVIGAAVLAAVAVLALLTAGDGVPVTVARVERDTLRETIPAEGRTRARDRFTVTAPITGRVSRIDVREGDMVEEGQILVQLFPAPEDPRTVATIRAEVDAAQARYAQAESFLREAELQAEQAEREVERRRPLLELGAITRERLEQAELAATVARQRLEAARAQLATAAASLEAARARLLGTGATTEDTRAVDVHAPVAGRVVNVPDQSARVVAAGTPLLELAEAEGLEIVFDILSEDAVRVRPGNEVVITGWGGEGTLVGHVRSVTLVGYTKISALGVEEQRVDVIADLLEVPPALGVGYRVDGEIVVSRGEDVLTVPTGALFRSGDLWQVFVVEDGEARLREVTVGRRNQSAAEIVSGLAEGELVVVFPPDEIEDGVAVEIVETAPVT